MLITKSHGRKTFFLFLTVFHLTKVQDLLSNNNTAKHMFHVFMVQIISQKLMLHMYITLLLSTTHFHVLFFNFSTVYQNLHNIFRSWCLICTGTISSLYHLKLSAVCNKVLSGDQLFEDVQINSSFFSFIKQFPFIRDNFMSNEGSGKHNNEP